MTEKSPAPRRSSRAAGVQRTRDCILGAARDHIVDSGFHRLGLEQVAEDAGVTRVTIYRTFGSKLGLLDAVGADLARRGGVVAGMRSAGAVEGAPSAFRAMVSALCRFWSVDPDLCRRLIGLAAVDPQAQQVVDRREEWRYEQVAAFVGRLAAEDRIRAPFDTEGAAGATAAVAAVTGFPACDAMATRLGVALADLDAPLVALLGSVVRLD